MSESTDRTEGQTDRVTTLWRRVKEHRIAQWTVGYVAVAYGIQHAVTLTSEALDWPHAVTRISIILLAFGLPVAMTLAWYHGERVSRRISSGEMAIVSLLLVLISFAFYATFRTAPQIAIRLPLTQEAGVATARTAAASPKGAVSVAVLPFVNLSSDKEQEFFSDGMTEEITAALAKVPDMRVVARTSAFEFKGKNINIKTMGEELGATHLIEGSVRKVGNRLRITAQLIKADDGTHIWAEDYDRDLTDVFAIQEDIARAITASLHMTLGLKPGENLVNNRDISPADYQQYLQARNLLLGRGRDNAVRGNAILEELVARNPNYAPAWAELGVSYYFLLSTGPERINGSDEVARRVTDHYVSALEAAARRAIQIDPNYAAGYVYLGVALFQRHKLVEADEMIARAFNLDPNDPNVLNSVMGGWAIEGRLKEAVSVARRLQEVEPYVPALNGNTAQLLWLDGDDESAIGLFKRLPPQNNQLRQLAELYASLGRYREAADLLDNISPGFRPAEELKLAARMLRMAAKASEAQSAPDLGILDWVFLYVGQPQRALDFYARDMKIGLGPLFEISHIRHSSYAPVRRTERFKTYVQFLGLPEFWRAKGWPPQCHSTAGDDFECS
ncbi:MAG TPA: hypothetical protein VFW28_09950 [Micropepsaceae bacterium]|nr:hypothetical protein [Micropepsaceae bacterium]